MKFFKHLFFAILACPIAAQAFDHQTEKEVRERFIDPVMSQRYPDYKFQTSEASRIGYRYVYSDTTKPVPTSIMITMDYTASGDAEEEKKRLDGWHRKAAKKTGPETVEAGLGDEAIGYDITKTHPKEIGGWVEARVGSRFVTVHSYQITLDEMRNLTKALVPLISSLPKPANFYDELIEKRLGMDETWIAKAIPALKQDPPDVSCFQRFSPDDVQLGFGYLLSEFGSRGGGYVESGALGLFLKDQLIALRAYVSPNFPRNLSPEDVTRVAPILKQIQTLCELKPSETIELEQIGYSAWHLEDAAKPLSNELLSVKYKAGLLDHHPDKETLAFLMTPFSGLEYGTRGGITGDFLQNRREFVKLKHLDADTCVYLMHSKNPVTRLTAIETLIHNAEAWKIDLKKLEPDFQIIYRSYPMVRTLNGCIVSRQPAETLVKSLSK